MAYDLSLYPATLKNLPLVTKEELGKKVWIYKSNTYAQETKSVFVSQMYQLHT